MDDNCFQTIEQLQQQSIYVEDHQLPIPNLTLQANPILPQGKHLDQPNDLLKYKIDFPSEDINLKKSNLPKLSMMSATFKNRKRYSSTNNSNSFNIPAFNNNGQQICVRLQLRNKNKGGYILNDKKHKENGNSNMSEFSQFFKKDSVVYKRFDNSLFNYFSKLGKRYYASVFIDIKQAQKKQKITDLYQFLVKHHPYKYQYSMLEQNLKFDSNFQSGNLLAAHKISQKQYDCFMQNDTNTKGSTQWFYFKVRNTKRMKVKFNIINFYKPSSLYGKGMKPLIFSTQKHKYTKQDWKRGGQAINYQQSIITDSQIYYKLSFTYQFEYSQDEVYFAYSYPYTYTELKKYIQKIIQNPNNKKILKSEIICKTLMYKNIYLLQITEDINSKEKKKKQVIYILARQHAGQSPASFVLQGVVNYLLSNRLQSFQLRSKFIFKIIPMVNPDGVTVGNYRTNLSGNDVNRKWDFPNKIYHSQIVGIKKRILEDKNLIKMFLDLHAHSRKMNSFFYGGQSDCNENKLFPYICSRFNKDISFQECSYINDASKKSTARVVFQDDFSIKKSYTFETSFYGRQKNGKRQHFQKNDLRMLGQGLMVGIFYTQLRMFQQQNNWSILQKLNILKQNQTQISNFQEDKYLKQIKIIQGTAKQLKQKWKKQINNQYFHKYEVSIGSDSDPDQFQLKGNQIQQFQQLQEQLTKILNRVDKIENNHHNQTITLPINTKDIKRGNQHLPKTWQLKKDDKQTGAVNSSQNKQLLAIQSSKKGNSVNIQQISLCLQKQIKKQQKNYKYSVMELKKTLKYLIDKKQPKNQNGQKKQQNQNSVFSPPKNTQLIKNLNKVNQKSLDSNITIDNTSNNKQIHSYDQTMDLSYIPLSYNKSLQRTRIFKMNGRNLRTNKVILTQKNI